MSRIAPESSMAAASFEQEIVGSSITEGYRQEMIPVGTQPDVIDYDAELSKAIVTGAATGPASEASRPEDHPKGGTYEDFVRRCPRGAALAINSPEQARKEFNAHQEGKKTFVEEQAEKGRAKMEAIKAAAKARAAEATVPAESSSKTGEVQANAVAVVGRTVESRVDSAEPRLQQSVIVEQATASKLIEATVPDSDLEVKTEPVLRHEPAMVDQNEPPKLQHEMPVLIPEIEHRLALKSMQIAEVSEPQFTTLATVEFTGDNTTLSEINDVQQKYEPMLIESIVATEIVAVLEPEAIALYVPEVVPVAEDTADNGIEASSPVYEPSVQEDPNVAAVIKIILSPDVIMEDDGSLLVAEATTIQPVEVLEPVVTITEAAMDTYQELLVLVASPEEFIDVQLITEEGLSADIAQRTHEDDQPEGKITSYIQDVEGADQDTFDFKRLVGAGHNNLLQVESKTLDVIIEANTEQDFAETFVRVVSRLHEITAEGVEISELENITLTAITETLDKVLEVMNSTIRNIESDKSKSSLLTPELTQQLLTLLEAIGFEDPQATLLEFVGRYDFEFLLQAMRYLHQLSHDDVHAESVLRSFSISITVPDKEPLKRRIGRAIVSPMRPHQEAMAAA